MIPSKEYFDLLLVEESDNIIYLFQEVSKTFSLSIKFARNLDEFIDLASTYEFKYILCNFHIEHTFSGLLLSRMYNNIKKIKVNDGKLFFYSFQHNSSLELAKMSLDDLTEQKYTNFYDFLNENFYEQFLNYFNSQNFKQSLSV